MLEFVRYKNKTTIKTKLNEYQELCMEVNILQSWNNVEVEVNLQIHYLQESN